MVPFFIVNALEMIASVVAVYYWTRVQKDPDKHLKMAAYWTSIFFMVHLMGLCYNLRPYVPAKFIRYIPDLLASTW